MIIRFLWLLIFAQIAEKRRKLNIVRFGVDDRMDRQVREVSVNTLVTRRIMQQWDNRDVKAEVSFSIH